ncbi:MAG: hypothetical protein P1R74_11865, partial [Sedimenticola sp.]|nr:hypothetical protein [Sedimenticola sp.]
MSPLSRLAIRNDGVLGEQLAAQLSTELGLPVKVLQNNSNHGVDLYAYDVANNRYLVIEVKSSETGRFPKLKIPAERFLETRAKSAAAGKGFWKPEST